MALSFTYGSPETVLYAGGLTLQAVDVNITGDAAATSGTAAVPHGAPSGLTISHAWCAPETVDAGDDDKIIGISAFSTDTANDEIDVTFTASAALDAKVSTVKLYYVFPAAEPDVGLSSAIDY